MGSIKLRPVEGIIFDGRNVDEVTDWIARNILGVEGITVSYEVDMNGHRTAEIVFKDPSDNSRVSVCTGCAVTSGARRVYWPKEVES